MKTTVPDNLSPGLTDQQLECLQILIDGHWHDRNEIRQKIRNYIPANISGRIIGPLEKRSIVEQEERPVQDGSRKLKKFVRIKKDIDEDWLHSLIEYSANYLVVKYSKKKCSERANFFLNVRNSSIKRRDELEKLEEERRQKEEEAYWTSRFQRDDSESWHELTATEKNVYEILRSRCHRCFETGRIQEEDCLKGTYTSFLIACRVMPDLIRKILDEERKAAEDRMRQALKNDPNYTGLLRPKEIDLNYRVDFDQPPK